MIDSDGHMARSAVKVLLRTTPVCNAGVRKASGYG
jgi:hypothetical protein